MGCLGQTTIKLICEKNIDEVTKIVVFDFCIKAPDEAKLTKCCEKANIAIEFVCGDITDVKAVRAASTGVDLIIHMAAKIDFKGLVSEEILHNINVQGTQHVIDACVDNNIPHLLYTSSLEAICPNNFGDDFVNGSEDTNYRGEPMGKYGRTKKQAEDLVTDANGFQLENNKILRTLSLRMAGVYLEGDQFLKRIIENAKDTKEVVTMCTKRNSRMYAGNSAWCHMVAAKQLQTCGNDVTGKAYFIRDDSPDRDFVGLIMEFIKHRGFTKKTTRVPFAVIYAMTWLLTLVYMILHKFGIRKEPSMTTLTLRLVSTEFTTSDAKFRRDFTYEPLYSWPESRERMKKWVDVHLGENLKDK